jgi:hypothetical protein
MIVNDFPTNSEYWRVIDGFPNYDVSTDGRVRNSQTGKMRKLQVMKNGYIHIGLSKDNKDSIHYVHRLVATAFCNKSDDCNVVDHIDRNPSNCNYQNLRWTTMSGNQRNKSKHKNNTSGISGVSFDEINNRWRVTWSGNNGKEQMKAFSVKKLGYEQAKQMAINHRKQMAEANGYLNV